MKIKCPACAAVLNVPDSAAGKVVKCPCGKQLRAPGAPAQPAAPTQPAARASAPVPAQPRATPQRATPQRPTPQRPTPQRPAAGGGGADAGMFDELTDQDLGGVTAVPRPGQVRPVSAGPSTAGSKLMQQYAPTGTAGYQSSGNMQIAGAGARLTGAIVDGLFQTLFLAIGFGGFIGIVAVGGEEPPPVLVVLGFGILMVCVLLPIIVNAYLVTKDGQTVGKKAVGTRIVIQATGQLPGFVQGWLVRFFLFSILNQFVPFLALIDVLFVFSENAQTLHDRLAGTVVINA